MIVQLEQLALNKIFMEEKKIENLQDFQEFPKSEIESLSKLEKEKELKEPSYEKESLKTENEKDLLKNNILDESDPIINSSSNKSSLVFKEREEAIDKILAEGLNNVFLQLKPDKQKEFKEKGEETVKKINILLSETKLRVDKIINLIKKWLSIIPGVNKFFVEQEAKLKADKIIKVKNNF